MKSGWEQVKNTWSCLRAPAARMDYIVAALLGVLWMGWIWYQLPLVQGRDYGRYVIAFYDLGSTAPPQPVTMMYRGFLTSCLIGLFHEAGGKPVFEIFMAVGGWFVWNAAFFIGARFCRLAGWLALVFLALDVPFWELFRSVASEPFWIVALFAWYFALRRAFLSRDWKSAALFGLMTGLLPLFRPSGQPFVAGCLLLLCAGGGWRFQARRAGLALAVALGILVTYASYNKARYHDFAIARGANATLPLQRLICTDGLVRVENGPVSREVAEVVQRNLLDRSPYWEYGINQELFFTGGGNRPFWDLVGTIDAEYGWDSDYAILKKLAWEALAADPWAYVDAVCNSFALHFEVVENPFGRTKAVQEERRALLERLHREWETKGLAIPSEMEIIPAGIKPMVQGLPEGYAPAKRTEWASERIRQARSSLPSSRQRSEAFRPWSKAFKKLWPPVFLWVLASAFLVPAWRREEKTEAWPLLGLCVMSLLVLFSSTLAIGHVEKYRILFDPVLIGCGAAGLGAVLGRKS